MAMSTTAGLCQSVLGRIAWAAANDQRRSGRYRFGRHGWSPERHALVARRQEAVVVDVGELRRAREPERLGDLADVAGKPLRS